MPYYIDEEHSDILFEVNGDQVAFKESNPGSGGSGGNLPYVIQEKDATTPTDRNLFSSKRVLAEVAKGSQSLQDEYLSKKKDDRTPHLLSSDKGFEVGEFVTGESGGKVWLNAETLKVLLELDRILVRDHIVIGDALLEYDAANKAVCVRHRDAEEEESGPIQVGFYAEGFVSAKGASSGGQGGGGGASALYGLNDVLRNEAGDGVMGASAGKVLMFNGTHWYAGDAKGKVVAVKVGQEEYKPSEEGIVTLPEFAKVVDKSITVDKFIGDLQGNADTATKLKNELTIWGQKFDGSANVSGAMTDVTSITIGDCVISYDSVNKGLKFSTGIYSEQYVSAKGAGSSSSGAGGASSVKLGGVLYTPDSDGVVNLPAYPTVPTSLKNPYAITIQANGVSLGIYDGSAEKIVNLTHENIGAAAATHTHAISQVTGLQESLSDKYSSTVSRTANTVLAAPDGGNGVASFRKLVAADIPSLSHKYLSVSGGVIGSETAISAAVYWSSKKSKLCIVSDGTNGNFIESGNVDFTGSSSLHITGYFGKTGSNLYLNFENIYCRASGYTNLDSGNYTDYAAKKEHTHTISDVTNLQDSLDSKLNASIFTDLFEKVLLSDGVTYAIRAKYGFYSDYFVSAKGANSESGSGGGGVGSIYIGNTQYNADSEGIVRLPAYPTVPTELKNPYALTIQKNGITQGVYDGSTEKSVNITVPTKVSELTNDSNFLTKHQAIYALTIQGNGTELSVYTPNSAAKIINITAAGIGAAAATHKQAYTADACTTYTTDNENMGVTPAAVKKAIGLFEPKSHTHTISQVTDLAATLAKYYDSTISRIANTVLAAPNGSNGSATFRKLVEADIPSLDWSKITSGKPTTLAGYGITDGVNSVTVSGSGNAVTSASVIGNRLTLTKGETFLAKSIFDDLFEKVLLSDGVTYTIRAKYGFYSDSFVSAKGANAESGGGGGGVGSIYVGTTQYNADSEGIVRLPAYPTVPTSLKNPYALTIQANGTTLGIYDGSAAKTLNLTYANVGAAAASHKQAYTANECTTYTTDDNTMGVTPAAVKKAIGLFDPKEHTHNSLGTLTVGSSSHPVYFNAGVPTAVDKTATFNALVNSTTIGYSTPVDADYYISQSVDGGTSITTYHRRSHSALYAYLKGKAEGTWGINVSGYAGALYKANYITNLNSPIWGITDGYSINYNNCDSTVSNAPSGIDNANLIMNIQNGKHGTSGQYGWQVGFFHSLNAPYVRKWTGGSVGSWIKLLTSGNYNEFAPSKDGTGASGTWGINVSGNAATATKLNNYYNARPSNANLSPDGSGGMCKFLATSTMTSNKPAVDGHILHFHWDNTGGWDAQLMIPCNGNASNEPQWRAQNSGTWGSWISLVTSGTIGNYNAGSATKLQTARTIWGQSFNGTANVSGTITGSYFKINDNSTSPYLWLNGWYVQVNNSMLQMGNAAEYSIKVDSSGNLILPTSSRRIYFNGSTSDNQCIVYDNSSGRLSVGSSAAKGFNVGDLLVSSALADYTLVPTNGIYSKGDIYSAGAITAKASSSDIRLKRDLTEYDALSIVRGQRSVMYHWNEKAKRNSAIFDDDDWHYGLIAQELQREHPQLVKDVFGDYLTIDYERLIPILWRAVQQLAKRNEELEQMINERRKAA